MKEGRKDKKEGLLLIEGLIPILCTFFTFFFNFLVIELFPFNHLIFIFELFLAYEQGDRNVQGTSRKMIDRVVSIHNLGLKGSKLDYCLVRSHNSLTLLLLFYSCMVVYLFDCG